MDETGFLIFGAEDRDGPATKIEDFILLYHAGISEIKEPKIIKQPVTRDFGSGFYLTKSKKQAEDFILTPKFKGRGVVNVYKYYPNRLTGLKIRIFEEVDVEWLKFVAGCRLGYDHDLDMAEGAMADDEIWEIAQEITNLDDIDDDLVEYMKFRKFTHQVCLLSEEALRSIEFYRSYEKYAIYSRR